MYDYLFKIQGIGTRWVIIGVNSLGIRFDYICMSKLELR